MMDALKRARLDYLKTREARARKALTNAIKANQSKRAEELDHLIRGLQHEALHLRLPTKPGRSRPPAL